MTTIKDNITCGLYSQGSGFWDVAKNVVNYLTPREDFNDLYSDTFEPNPLTYWRTDERGNIKNKTPNEIYREEAIRKAFKDTPGYFEEFIEDPTARITSRKELKKFSQHDKENKIKQFFDSLGDEYVSEDEDIHFPGNFDERSFKWYQPFQPKEKNIGKSYDKYGNKKKIVKQYEKHRS